MKGIGSRLLLAAAALLVLSATGAGYTSQEKQAKEEEAEEKVTMQDLPAAVQRAVRQQSRGARIRGLTREIEDGKTFYEVELEVNGRTRDVTIDPEGVVVKVEEEVPLSSLPAAVRASIEKRAAGGRILLVESIREKGPIVMYEAHVETAGGEIEIKVDPRGRLIPEEPRK